MVETQVDIAFITSMVSCFAKTSRLDHFSAVNQILRNLADNFEKDITIGRESKF